MSKLKKQLIASGCVLICAIVLFLVYFGITEWNKYKEYEETFDATEGEEKLSFFEFVFKGDSTEKQNSDTAEQRDDFGVLMKNGRHFIVNPVEVSDIKSIHIHNTLDDYTLIHDGDSWVFKGAENYSANEELLPTLRTNTRYLLSIDYVESADLTDKSIYGIDIQNPAVWFELEHTNGIWRILIGDKTPDNSGYYAMLEGREALYVLDTGVEESVLLTLNDYINPEIIDTVSTENISSLERLSIYNGEDLFLRIEESHDTLTMGNNSLHRLTFPLSGHATSLTNFSAFLETMAEISGEKTLLFGDNLTTDALRELGFIDETGEFICQKSLIAEYPDQYISLRFVENGDNYIIYSEQKNIVVIAPKSSFSFLDWELISWVSSEIYLMDIFEVETIEIITPSKRGLFELSGESDIEVVCNSQSVTAEDFKSTYQALMYIYVVNWGENPGETEEILNIKISLKSGEVLDYSFKSVSAVNCFYSLNSDGRFYVEKEKVLELRSLFEALIP